MRGAGRKFMELTTYGVMDDAPQRSGGIQPPLEIPVAPGEELIALPDHHVAQASSMSLVDAIEHRRSLRSYSDESISLAELSYLLWCCQGVQQAFPKHSLRTVPSAGARHAFETYVLVNRVQGLMPGLYRFVALQHSLAVVDLSAEITERLTAACLGQAMVSTSAISVFWTAAVERMYFRYGERGYRYLHLDAGHACQNLLLAAESIGCGACAIAAFGDEAANEALGLDGVGRFLVYVATVGKK